MKEIKIFSNKINNKKLRHKKFHNSKYYKIIIIIYLDKNHNNNKIK